MVLSVMSVPHNDASGVYFATMMINSKIQATIFYFNIQ